MNLSLGTLGVIRFIHTFAETFSVEFCMVALIGYLSKKLPKGIEATGIVIILSSISLAYGFSGSLGVNQMNAFKVKDGYYERGADLLMNGYKITFYLNVVAPLFLIWRG